MKNFRDVEIFDESGFWYAADFEDLTPFTLYSTFAFKIPIKYMMAGYLVILIHAKMFICKFLKILFFIIPCYNPTNNNISMPVF